jgi:hypothetical protein
MTTNWSTVLLRFTVELAHADHPASEQLRLAPITRVLSSTAAFCGGAVTIRKTR